MSFEFESFEFFQYFKNTGFFDLKKFNQVSITNCLNTCKFLQTKSRTRRTFSRPDVIINIDGERYVISQKMFLRAFRYKKLIQVKFHCVMSDWNDYFVKNLAIDKQSLNCILEIAFKCPESIVSRLKSHQPIITFIMQEYQPLLKFCRKIPFICSTILCEAV